MQVIAELTDECFFRARPGQESSIGMQRIKRAKEAKTLDESTHKRIYGDHTFRFELTEWQTGSESEGNQRTDRHIRRYAYRCGESAERHCRPDRCGGGTRAAGVRPALA